MTKHRESGTSIQWSTIQLWQEKHMTISINWGRVISGLGNQKQNVNDNLQHATLWVGKSWGCKILMDLLICAQRPTKDKSETSENWLPRVWGGLGLKFKKKKKKNPRFVTLFWIHCSNNLLNWGHMNVIRKWVRMEGTPHWTNFNR